MRLLKPRSFFRPTNPEMEGERRSASTSKTRLSVRPKIIAKARDVDDLPSLGRVLITAIDLGKPWLVANARLERIEK